jgi:superfamily II DNA helicase RecQ
METQSNTHIPSLLEIREKAFKIFGRQPCLWQIRVVEAILRHNRDIVSIAAIGAGKTLTFWMPLLFREDGMKIIISPLESRMWQILQHLGLAE